MIRIDYPAPDFRIKKEKEKEFIFDSIRKQWVRLTPEEWVRQNFLRYLLQVKGYPVALIAIEKEMKLGELKKRFDILIYNKNHQPWMMVECKAMQEPLNEAVLHQVLRYNISIPVSYLVITNGNLLYGWRRANNELKTIDLLPEME